MYFSEWPRTLLFVQLQFRAVCSIFTNITKSGLVVFGVLNGLTSGHRYYCRAAAVNDEMTVPNENENMTMHLNFSTLSTIKSNVHIGTVLYLLSTQCVIFN